MGRSRQTLPVLWLPLHLPQRDGLAFLQSHHYYKKRAVSFCSLKFLHRIAFLEIHTSLSAFSSVRSSRLHRDECFTLWSPKDRVFFILEYSMGLKVCYFTCKYNKWVLVSTKFWKECFVELGCEVQLTKFDSVFVTCRKYY